MMTVSLFLSAFFISCVWSDCDKAALNIKSPKTMKALNGSCLHIPCTFIPKENQSFNSTGSIIGVWIKNDSRFKINQRNVVFNSSRRDNSYTMRITGNLSEKNCTTLLSNVLSSYSDKYFFRIESSNFTATAPCDPLDITVKDSAWSPRLEIPGVLKEKQSVTIICSALTPCPHSPPKLTWSLQRDSQNNMKKNTDGTFTTKIQETINLSDKHNGNIITCSVKYPVNEGKDVKTAEETQMLNVAYAPKDTSVSISPSGLVSAGEQVNLTCSSRANPPVSRFTWFKISKDGAEKVSEGEVYSFTVTDGGVYYCVALNDVGNQTSSRIEPIKKGTWMAVLGGILGVILLLCGGVVIWWFKSKPSTSHNFPQHVKRDTFEEAAVPEPAQTPYKEDIQYGEINFSKGRSDPGSKPEQNRGHQQETLYAEVKVRDNNQPESSSTPASVGPDDLYAQVKRK